MIINICKHCGSRFQSASGCGEFCCAGCEHVFNLIQVGGLDEYYTQQDRVGQPVGNRPFKDCDFVSINQIQEQAESRGQCALSLNINGMSCMGCAWLVEQLCRRQPGIRTAQVALNANCLSLCWVPGHFNLPALAGDLQKFGYQLSGEVAAAAAVSPLMRGLGLTLVFSLNGLLLLAAAAAGVGGAGLRPLYNLLIALCLVFAQLIGGALFVSTAWGALRLRQLHSDLLPALLLLSLFTVALLLLLLPQAWLVPAAVYFSLLTVLVFARWLSELLERRKMP